MKKGKTTMNNYQLDALNLYLDASKSLKEMSNKFFSIGINVEEVDENHPQTIQADYDSTIRALDKNIINVLHLEDDCNAEPFFETVMEYLNGSITKEYALKIIKKSHESI